MDNLWLQTLCLIDSDGVGLNSRAGKCSELLGYSMKLENVNKNFLFNRIRNLDPRYACAEFLWYMSMTDDTTFLQLFAPSYSRFCEDGIHAYGAYGYRWLTHGLHGDQITQVIETLRQHPESRQAVVTMWAGTDLEHALKLDRKDLPCTLTHQFLLREGYLHMVTTMRSNDAWLGLPYDVFCNTQLQKLIADILLVVTGTYTHTVGSMHYYERNFEKINEILSLNIKDLVVESPQSDHFSSVSKLDYKKQVSEAIKFVKLCEIDEGNTVDYYLKIVDIRDFYTVISDAAFVCASKWKSSAVNFMVDPQLKLALEVFNE